ncbi:MAG: hypothetical protein QM731_17120 [Chitinophagaceae bacterium]
MKIKKLSALLLIAVTMFAACSKDKDDDVSIVGFWKGKYGSPLTTYPTNGYCFLFRSNGTVRVFDGTDTTTASKAEGTYTVSGTTVNTTYSYITGGSQYSTTGTVDSKFTFIEGTWGPGTNATSSGRFFINKQ